MTIDELIEQRNNLQLISEDRGKGDDCWVRLGVANRHIERILDGILPLSPAVEKEIVQCFERTRDWQKNFHYD